MGLKLASVKKTEYGDFQTPSMLAKRVCNFLHSRELCPVGVLEPTCGNGTFLQAAMQTFPSLRKVLGIEINPKYVKNSRALLERLDSVPYQVIESDFFRTKWRRVLKEVPSPMLILGNPPWVTSSQLGSLESSNMPAKINHDRHRGIEAITGKGNFDISEYMLQNILRWIDGTDGTMALLCKISVARKVLRYAWRSGLMLRGSEIRRINAFKHFGVSVEAGLLVVSGTSTHPEVECSVYDSLDSGQSSSRFGMQDDTLVANLELYNRWKHLAGFQQYRWRSGIKHDCSRIMEFHRVGPRSYINGFHEKVDLEDLYMYPMLKSSDVANGSVVEPKRWMLVTQQTIGEDTEQIRSLAPLTWKYLCRHSNRLGQRRSSIYRNRPRFSIFGVGEYTFEQWKVAISGFYKQFRFRIIGSFEGKAIVLDDTCYSVSLASLEEATFVQGLLESQPAQQFLEAFVFWDEKRPVTTSLLGRLDLMAVARELESETKLERYLRKAGHFGHQLTLPWQSIGLDSEDGETS